MKALIFDLDGTLLDTLKDLAVSTNHVLENNGYPPHPLEAYNYLVGQGVRHLIEFALPQEARESRRIDRLVQEFSAYYEGHWDVHTRPYDGIREMLDRLFQTGRPIGILSNKPHNFTVLCVDKMLAGYPFTLVMGHREPFPRKPDPQSALHMARELNLAPREIMFCGDTSIDMQTATRAGMYAVGVTWGFRPRGELLENGARQLAESPADVITIFNAAE